MDSEISFGAPTPEVKNIEAIISPAEQLILLDDAAVWMNQIEEEKPDVVYFLDKSARPLAWFFREVSPKDGSAPAIRFLNIGSEKENGFDIITDHAKFPELKNGGGQHPSKIMIIDEKSASGDSLKRAKKVVQTLYGVGDSQIVLHSALSRYPSWYGKDEMIGVADPLDSQYSALSQPVIDMEISTNELELIEKLRSDGFDDSKIEAQVLEIDMSETDKLALIGRLKLVLNPRNASTLTVNPQLSPWESVRRRGDVLLRQEVRKLADAFGYYLKKNDAFNEIKTDVLTRNFDREKLPSFFELEWGQDENIFICDANDMTKLADKIDSGEMSVKEGMYVYFLIKYNRIHPTDWGEDAKNYYDTKCPSLNYLSEKIIAKLK